MIKQKEAQVGILQEWLKRPIEKRRESDILPFYGYLQQNRPDLLSFRFRGGDKYQLLKSFLRNFINRDS